jgi:hypothetical protein
MIDKHIRAKLDDDEDERWSDEVLVNLIKEVVEQVETIGQRYGIQFFKYKTTLETVGEQDFIDISSLDPPIGGVIWLYRDSNQQRIVHEDEDRWETIYSTGELRHFLLFDDKIYFKGTPNAVEPLTLWYWGNIDTEAYDVDTEAPWGGKMDFIIAQHVVVTCQNIDEMDIGMDSKWLKSLEYQIARKFSGLAPRKRVGRGWMKPGFINYRVGT